MSVPLLPSSSGARRGEADGGTNTGVGRSATTGQGGAVQHPRLSLLELRNEHIIHKNIPKVEGVRRLVHVV